MGEWFFRFVTGFRSHTTPNFFAKLIKAVEEIWKKREMRLVIYLENPTFLKFDEKKRYEDLAVALNFIKSQGFLIIWA